MQPFDWAEIFQQNLSLEVDGHSQKGVWGNVFLNARWSLNFPKMLFAKNKLECTKSLQPIHACNEYKPSLLSTRVMENIGLLTVVYFGLTGQTLATQPLKCLLETWIDSAADFLQG